MSKRCQVTNKRPLNGKKISHSQQKTSRRFIPNLQNHRFWIASKKCFVRLRVSAKGIRILDRIGIETFLKMRKDAANN